jgi:hypothetical protein
MGGKGGFAGRGETWLTPRATDTNNGESSETFVKRMGDRGSHCSGSLAAQASRYWTTQDVCSGARDMSKIDPELQKRADTKRTTGLPTEAVNWPTPAARDHKGANSAEHALETGSGRKHMDQLSNFVAHSSHLAQPMPDGQSSCESGPDSPQPSTKRLNPAFGEWLMGWPVGWSIAEPSASSASETASWRFALQQQLSCLFIE